MQNMTASDTNPLNFLKLKVRISRARKFRETVSDAVTRTNVSRNFVTVKQMTNAQTNRPKTPRRANVKSANYPPFEIAENTREPCRRCPERKPPEILTAPAGWNGKEVRRMEQTRKTLRQLLAPDAHIIAATIRRARRITTGTLTRAEDIAARHRARSR